MIKLCAFADESGSSLQEQIDALKRNNIHYLELRNVDGINVLDFTLDFAQSIKNELDKNGIEVFSIGSPIGKVDATINIDEYMSKVEHICKIAKIMNAKNIRMFSFYNAYDKEELVFDKLNKMVSFVNENYGLNLCHENEKDIYGDVLDRILKIKENVRDLKFVYDPANFIQSNDDIQKCLDTLVNNVHYYHIKDVDGDDNVVPAGCGNGLIKEMLSKIDQDTVLTIEPHLSLFIGYASIDKTVLKTKFEFKNNVESFDYAVKSLKELLISTNYKEVVDGFVKNE